MEILNYPVREETQTIDELFTIEWSKAELPDSLRTFCREWFGKGAREMYGAVMKNENDLPF